MIERNGLKFNIRTKKGFEDNICDKLVIQEIIDDDVYQIGDVKDGVIVDIGANIGAFSILAASLGAKKVYAFEPEEENYNILVDHIKLNGFEDVIIPINKGIYSKHENKVFVPGQGASIVEDMVNDKKALKAGGALRSEVEMITLQEMLDLIGEEIDLMKVDCEWSEYQIFPEATFEQLNQIKRITMEFHSCLDNPEVFGKMLYKFTHVFNLHTIGSYQRGGQLYGTRY